MKKIIFLLMFILLSGTVLAATTAQYVMQTVPDQNADTTTYTGDAWDKFGSANITDANYTTYGETLANVSTLFLNFTDWVDSSSDSKIQIVYNDSIGSIAYVNYTSGSCFNKDSANKIQLKIVSNNTNATYGDGIERIRTYCGNYSSWTELTSQDSADNIFDARIYWYIPAGNYTFNWNIIRPDEYATLTSTSVDFNVSANWTGNLTATMNCSLYTREDNSSGNYIINVSDFVLANTSYANKTLIFASGKRVWWYWACEDNNSRSISNSTVRIFDVDTTYDWLSIGTNKVINFSVSTGNGVFAGNVTALNYFGTFLGTISDLATLIQNRTIIRSGFNESWIVNAVGNWTLDKSSYPLASSLPNITFQQINNSNGNWSLDRPTVLVNQSSANHTQVYVSSLLKLYPVIVTYACDETREGQIVYNATKTFYACNSTDWNRLY